MRGPGHRRPAHARTAAVVRGALGGLATSAGGMTGPNLATRVGAAITRRRPASAPPDAPSQDAEPAQPPATPPAPGTQRNRPSPAWALAVLRRHWLFAALLTAGLVLRVLTTAAYHP